jgi:hypothetical protein
MEVSGQIYAPAALPSGREPLDRRLGGPQSRSGRGGEENRRESNRRIPIVQPVAQRYTDWAITALYDIPN